MAGKLGAVVGVGGGEPEKAADNIQKFFEYNQIDCVGTVTAQGAAACFTCGNGETCEVSAVHMFFGPGTKITPEIVPDLCKQPEQIKAAQALGRTLHDRLQASALAT